MNVLLDAHALLWYLAGSPRLSEKALVAINDSRNTLFVSPATLWELSIKDSLGKLILPEPFERLFPAKLDENNMILLPILPSHLHEHRRLPLHHHDPFDRLIIAQAIAEDLAIVSCDSAFPAYDVNLLW